MTISATEKLMLLMLCDLLEKSGHSVSEDTAFVRKVITNGNSWALRVRWPHLFEDDTDREAVRSEVCQILDMWKQIEDSFRLLPRDQQAVLSREWPIKGGLSFAGFDKSDYAHAEVALCLVDDLGMHEGFRERFISSRRTGYWKLDGYRRMLQVFETPECPVPDGKSLGFERMSALVAAFCDRRDQAPLYHEVLS